MNIPKMNPSIKNIFGTSDKTSSKSNLDFTIKDTVSFSGSVTIKKKIDDFKNLKPEKYSSQDINDVKDIMDHFGFKLTKDYPSLLYTGPYGQTINLGRGKKVTPSFMENFVAALNRADDFNGELIFFEHPMTQDEKAEWVKKLAERKPNKGQINQYALDLLKQDKKVEKPEIVDTSKESDRIKNEQKTQVYCAISSVNREQEDLDYFSSHFEDLKNQIKQYKFFSFEEDITSIEDKIQEKQEKISLKNKQLEAFRIKLSTENLSEEELAKVQEYEENEVSLEDVENKISVLEEKIINSLINKDEVKSSFVSQIEKADFSIYSFEEDISIIKNELEEYKIYVSLSSSVNKAIETIEKVEKELFETKKQVENYKKTDLEKVSPQVVDTTIKKIIDINDEKLVGIKGQIDSAREIIDAEIKPMLEDNEKMKDRRKEALDKKFGFYPHKTSDEPKVDNDKSSTAVDEVETVEDIEETEFVETPASVEEESDITPLVSDDKQTTFSEIKKDLAIKLSFLPLPNVSQEIEKLLDKKLDVNKINNLSNDELTIANFVKKVISEFVQSNQYVKINTALRFALLDEIYHSTKNKDSNIYSLNAEQTMSLLDKVKNGEKDFSIVSDDKQIDISLEKEIDFEKINDVFAYFNQGMQKVEAKKGDKIIYELTKYTPNLSQNKILSVRMQASLEGKYLELLADKDANKGLKKELLKNFWDKFDVNNNTNISSEVINGFELEQEQLDKEQKEKQKLDNITKQNWTIF